MILWLDNEGKEQDVVISTRVRLARNIKKIPFPHLIHGSKYEQDVINTARDAFEGKTDFRFIKMSDISGNEKSRYIESHLISPELAANPNGVLIISPNEQLSIMVLEEDHFRLQCMMSGLNVKNALKSAMELDKMLNKSAEYAFDDKLGYLTSCPTNVGTGLRISVMMHLPGLAMTNSIRSLYNSIGKLGFEVRGLYGEGSAADGNVYQISNQITLGLSETEIADNIENMVGQIIEKEREARNKLLEIAGVDIKDRIMRAYGNLKYAVKIDSKEAIQLISLINLGVSLGFIENERNNELYKLMIEIMPAMVGEHTQIERDIKRAEIIKKALK